MCVSFAQDCQTRWGSMQKMVDRILEQEKAIHIVLGSDRKTSHLTLTWQDLDVLTAINKALCPLATFTDVTSGEKYVTSSSILPIMDLLSNSVLKENEDDVALTNNIRATILTDLSIRNTNVEVIKVLEVASFMDPRFKTKFVTDVEALTDVVKEPHLSRVNIVNKL